MAGKVSIHFSKFKQRLFSIDKFNSEMVFGIINARNCQSRDQSLQNPLGPVTVKHVLNLI